jgi:hypothetical protein
MMTAVARGSDVDHWNCDKVNKFNCGGLSVISFMAGTEDQQCFVPVT